MNTNQQVTGNYYGAPFSGVITSKRMLTVKTDGCFEFSVNLEKPITVFSQERDSILVYAKFDGSPSSYTKFRDELKAA